ncbi:MAG TPA: DUF1501 domain-containing protein [Geminicoccaceae bacterium]|nr:DUF1501 domain-containing protein [Geminicoccaceae bacterium]
MDRRFLRARGITRRELARAGLGGAAALCTLGGIPAHSVFGRIAHAVAPPRASNQRILVVFEMSGGNDGLNTLVPYGDDAYYRHRPTIGLKPDGLLRLDDHFALNPGMVGFERLWRAGDLAIVHGCGYDNPSFSHFTSMAYWQTAAPNSGAEYGWVGRLADAMDPAGTPNFVVNVGATQSLAVRSAEHVPVVFDDPDTFQRAGFFQEQPVFEHVAPADGVDNPARRYLLEVARSALDASALVREAWASFRTPIDYGLVPLDLDKVAALIAADLPARLYYASFRNNAFDTHVHQNDLHQRLLTYAADAIAAFMADMERIGRADDVVLLAFSEFGRRVPENTSLGTDHGTAGPMFVVGKPVAGGYYGALPSLTDLVEGDNLRHTTDFRRVYATVAGGWLGYPDTDGLLGGEFPPLPMFA